MARRVDLFCEDAAHEGWARALVQRIASEEPLALTVRVASARFGIPRMKSELRAFERLLRRGAGLPDLLVVIVDANAVGPLARRREIEDAIDLGAFPHVVVGTPDPCIERWYLADPSSFSDRFGKVDPPDAAHGDAWKTALVAALEQAGELVTAGGSEFADEIVETMDLYRAGRASPTLMSFVDDLRGAIRQLARDD